MLNNDFYHIIQSSADSVSVHFNAAHPIYAAHFPGKPITPGACLLTMSEEIISQLTGEKLRIHEIRNLKFITPVLTETQLTFHFQKKEELTYSITLTDDSTIYAKMSIQYMRYHTNL